MPGRRPYASRGVPRRATTRRSGVFRFSHASAWLGVAALLGVVLLASAFLVWLTRPLFLGDATDPQALSSIASSSDAAAGASLQMSNVAPPTPQAAGSASAAARPALPPLTRRWDP